MYIHTDSHTQTTFDRVPGFELRKASEVTTRKAAKKQVKTFVAIFGKRPSSTLAMNLGNLHKTVSHW